MILDALRNKDCYRTLAPRIARALDYCAGVTERDFAEKTVELDGKNLYAMYQAYTSAGLAGREAESHRRYIDLQYIVAGEETIRVTATADMKTTKPYDPDQDIEFYEPVPGTDLRLRAGDFTILFPQDAHLPKLSTHGETAVKKVVVKILIA